MNKIENNLIFEAYTKKHEKPCKCGSKDCPECAKHMKKGKKTKLEEKKSCGCKGQCKCGKGKKKVVSEHHEKYPPELLDMTVGDLLSRVEGSDLYHHIERYLDTNMGELEASRSELASLGAPEAPVAQVGI